MQYSGTCTGATSFMERVIAPATDTSLRLSRHRSHWIARLARVVVVAMVIGLGIGWMYWAAVDWSLPDAGAYWNAALRLRAGEPLYPAVADHEASEVYRYAPWFAWLAIPFTFLPVELSGAIWSSILVGASVAAVVPLLRQRAWLQAAFFFPILIGISAIGNVQALMIAALVWGVERRSGPLWIAMAASLKAFPILFALVYLGRRQWGRFAVTIVLTGLLVAPMLLYSLENYPTSMGRVGSLSSWPPVYAVAVLVCAASTLRLADTRWSWLAAATTVTFALPRLWVYDVTLLLPSVPASPPQTAERHPPLESDIVSGSRGTDQQPR